MDILPHDILCLILWTIDDIQSIERVCKRWRDASRQRSYLKSSKDVAVSLLSRYPRLTRFDGTLILNLYDKLDRDMVFERALLMKTLSLSVIMITLHKSEAVEAFRNIVKQAINLSCKTRICVLHPPKRSNTPIEIVEIGYIEVCQQTMTINLAVSLMLKEMVSDFATATKGQGYLTITHNSGGEVDSIVSWFIDLTDIVLDKLTLRYEGYADRFNMINVAKQIKEIVFVHHGSYTPFKYDGYPGKITYVADK